MNNESFYRAVIGHVGTTPKGPTSISKPYPASCLLLSYSHSYTPGFCCSTKIGLTLRCLYFNPCSKTPKELVPLFSVWTQSFLHSDLLHHLRHHALSLGCVSSSLRMLQAPLGFLYSASRCFTTPRPLPWKALLSPWEPVQLSALICYSLLAVPAATVLPFIVLCLPPSAVTTLASFVWFIFAHPDSLLVSRN